MGWNIASVLSSAPRPPSLFCSVPRPPHSSHLPSPLIICPSRDPGTFQKEVPKDPDVGIRPPNKLFPCCALQISEISVIPPSLSLCPLPKKNPLKDCPESQVFHMTHCSAESNKKFLLLQGSLGQSIYINFQLRVSRDFLTSRRKWGASDYF